MSTRGAIFLIVCAVVVIASISRGIVDMYALSRGGVRGKGCDIDLDNLGGIAFGERFCQEPIDIVYTWVNGSDPVWLRQMTYYRAAAAGEDPDQAVARLDGHARHPTRSTGNFSNATALLATNRSSVAACRALLNGTAIGNLTDFTAAQLVERGLPEDCNCTAVVALASHLEQASGGAEDGSGEQDDQSSANRYRDNEELRFSLRSLFKYAPWVRKVFLVTNGQVPHWLNLEHPRVDVISHSQIFPDPSDLPVFSSPAIEVHLHRIPGLSKRFVYFNDDVMLGAETWPEDFYAPSTGHKVYFSWEVPKCNPGCIDSWIGDGFCDKACNNSRCMWDAADCSGPDVKPGAGMTGSGSGTRSSGTAGASSAHTTTFYCSEGCPSTWLGDKTCDAKCEHPSCGMDAGDCGADVLFASAPGADAVCAFGHCGAQWLPPAEGPATDRDAEEVDEAALGGLDAGCSDASSPLERYRIAHARRLVDAGQAVAAEGIRSARELCVENWREATRNASGADRGSPEPLNATQCAEAEARDLEGLRTGDLEGDLGLVTVLLDPITVDLSASGAGRGSQAASSFYLNTSSLSAALARAALGAMGCLPGLTAGDVRNLTSRVSMSGRVPDETVCTACSGEDATDIRWTAAEYEEASASWLPHAVFAAHSHALVAVVSAVDDGSKEEREFAAALLPTVVNPDPDAEESLQQAALHRRQPPAERCKASVNKRACLAAQDQRAPDEELAATALSGQLPTALMAWTAGAYRRSKSFRLRPADSRRTRPTTTALHANASSGSNTSQPATEAVEEPDSAESLLHGVATELQAPPPPTGHRGTSWGDDRWAFGASLQQSAELSSKRRSRNGTASASVLPAPGTPFVVARTTITLSASLYRKRYQMTLPLSVVRRVPDLPVPSPSPKPSPSLASSRPPAQPAASEAVPGTVENKTGPRGNETAPESLQNNASMPLPLPRVVSNSSEQRAPQRKAIPVVAASPAARRRLSNADKNGGHETAWSATGLARHDASLALAAIDAALPAETTDRHGRRLGKAEEAKNVWQGQRQTPTTDKTSDGSLQRIWRWIDQWFDGVVLAVFGQHPGVAGSSSDAVRSAVSRESARQRLPVSLQDSQDAQLGRLQAAAAGASAGASRTATLRSLVSSAWKRLVQVSGEEHQSWPATSPPPPQTGRHGRRLDTYGDSLVFTNAIISSVVGRKTRKVPAHMPHMIDRDEMEKLQAWEPMRQAWIDTSRRRFRDPNDVQYAFAFFYWVMEAASAVEDRQGSEMLRFWQQELDADGDGHLNDNELHTLATVVKGGKLEDGDLRRVRDCVAPPGNATQTVERGEDGSITSSLTVVTPAITLESIMSCQAALEGVQRKVKDRMPASHTVAEESEVAFEMIGDDYNETLDKLDSVRARRTKFVCINDDMQEAPEALQRVLRDFFLSYFPHPCPFELEAGQRNPHLYVEPLKAHFRIKRWLQAAGGLMLLLVAAASLAKWRSSVEGAQKRGADAPEAGAADRAASRGTKLRQRRVSFSSDAQQADGDGLPSAAPVNASSALSGLGSSSVAVRAAKSSTPSKRFGRRGKR